MKPIVVVPCFNEAARLDLPRFVELLDGGVELLFVDDGSTDQTRALLEAFAMQHAGTSSMSLARNSGKGEAVRQGLLAAIRRGADVVGYLDADLATPPAELLRLVAALDEADVVLGSRVALLGRTIERHLHRHLIGRVFATGASIALGLRVYDTQCGAKAFKVTPALEATLAAPFASAWAFDVELLSRLLSPPNGVAGTDPTRIIELPLNHWRDIKGSKLRLNHMAKAGTDVLRMCVQRLWR